MYEARDLYYQLSKGTVNIINDKIDLTKTEEPVKAVLYGSASLDVSKVDVQTAALGADYSNPTSWARARESAVADVNGDGFADLTITVLTKDIRSLTPCFMNIWFYGKYADGSAIAAQDTVNVIKSF
jgi:hypothetical protein